MAQGTHNQFCVKFLLLFVEMALCYNLYDVLTDCFRLNLVLSFMILIRTFFHENVSFTGVEQDWCLYRDKSWSPGYHWSFQETFSGTKHILNLLTTDFEELWLVFYCLLCYTAASIMNVELLQRIPLRFRLCQ